MSYADEFANMEANGPKNSGERARSLAQKTVQGLGPYATTYTSSDNLGAYQTQLKYQAPGSYGIIQQVSDFAGNFGNQLAGIAGDVGKWFVNDVVDHVKVLWEAPMSIIKEFDISRNVDNNQKALDRYDAKFNNLMKSYKDGKISKEEYKKSLIELSGELDKINKQAAINVKDATNNQKEITKDVQLLAEDAITVVCAVYSGGLNMAVPQLAKSASTESVVPVVRFFGKREVSEGLYKAATKIDDIVNAIARNVNKVGTLNGAMPSGQIVRIVENATTNAFTGLTSKQIAKKVAVELLLKRPIIYQTNVAQAFDIYKSILNEDISGAVKSVAFCGAMTLSGGPMGFALKYIGKAGSWLKTAAYYSKNNVSRQSFADAFSTMFGSGAKSQIVEELTNRISKGNTEDIRWFNLMADTNMKLAGGDANAAASLIIDWFKQSTSGIAKVSKATAGEMIDDLISYAKTREDVIQTALKYNKGMTKEEAQRIVLGRANSDDKAAINKVLVAADKKFFKKGVTLNADNAQQLEKIRMAYITEFAYKKGTNNAWANSETFMGQVIDAIKYSKTTEEMTKRINKIATGKIFKGKLPKKLRDEMNKNGWIALMPENTYTPYISFNNASKKVVTEFAGTAKAVLGNGPDLFEQAVKPIPSLSHITGAMTKIGLSPQASQEAVYRTFTDNFDEFIKKNPSITGITSKIGNYADAPKRTLRSGKDILTKLYKYVRDYNAGEIAGHAKRAIVDIRQITKKEIMDALKCSESQAKTIMKGLNSSMLNVPIELRGLGDKIQDINIKFNPFAAQYARTQGTFRYTYNPFFKMQQTAQTEFLSQIEAGTKILQIPGLNKLNKYLYGPEKMKQIDEIIDILQKKNIFSQGYTGEGFSGDVFSLLGNRVIKSEKISMAGIIAKQAKLAKYTDMGKYIDDHFEQVSDVLKTVTVAFRTKGIIDSPLARTINTCFFPFQFNMKVAGVMAKQFSKFSAPTQVALISSLMDTKDWLDSDEGQAWQVQYADVIAMYNWITPTYPLSYVMKLAEDVVSPGDFTIGDLGLMGGLPFGMVSQILEANGIITASAPYINPKTGDVYPKYAPVDTAARVNQSLQAFLGSLFSYPGSLFGLPTKGELVRSVTDGIIGKGEIEVQPRYKELTAKQKRRSDIIKKASGNYSTSTPVVSTKTSKIYVPPSITAKPNQTIIDKELAKIKPKRKVYARMPGGK